MSRPHGDGPARLGWDDERAVADPAGERVGVEQPGLVLAVQAQQVVVRRQRSRRAVLRRRHATQHADDRPVTAVDVGEPLAVGQHRRDAIRLLGEPSSSYVTPRTQLPVLRYSGFRSFDGWLDIVIENDVVTSVSLEADWS